RRADSARWRTVAVACPTVYRRPDARGVRPRRDGAKTAGLPYGGNLCAAGEGGQNKSFKKFQNPPTSPLNMEARGAPKPIEEYLVKTEFSSLDELSEQVDASVSTVRRDLSVLEAKGTVRRTHGGARLVNPKSDEFAFSARDTHQLAEKEIIGKACADLIHP